jgi:tetratricopeptide (TPR) repeat protein
LLVRRVHEELVESVQADIRRREGTATSEHSLPRLMDDREWLILDNNYHIDTTHLAATVRFARALDDAEPLRLALELTEYGRRLAPQFQFTGEEPFADVYPAHAFFFRALLNENVEEALAFFREQAQAADDNEPVAAETYVGLLARLGRYREAVEAAATFLRAGQRVTREAPTLLELSRLAGNYSAALAAARERNDPVSYATGLLARGGR